MTEVVTRDVETGNDLAIPDTRDRTSAERSRRRRARRKLGLVVRKIVLEREILDSNRPVIDAVLKQAGITDCFAVTVSGDEVAQGEFAIQHEHAMLAQFSRARVGGNLCAYQAN